MSTTPAIPVATPVATQAPSPRPEASLGTPATSLGKEVRESALLLGLSLGVTAGLTVALQAALSVLS